MMDHTGKLIRDDFDSKTHSKCANRHPYTHTPRRSDVRVSPSRHQFGAWRSVGVKCIK